MKTTISRLGLRGLELWGLGMKLTDPKQTLCELLVNPYLLDSPVLYVISYP